MDHSYSEAIKSPACTIPLLCLICLKVMGDSFIINKLEYFKFFCLLVESEIALFPNEVWVRSAFDEKLARNSHYPPHHRW